MIKIFPSEKFTITTRFKPEGVENKLLSYVEPYKLIRFNLPFSPPPDKPFEGTVGNGYFKFQRIYSSKKKNSLPIIEGKIFPNDRGSIIEISIKPQQGMNTFMLIFPLFYIPIAVAIGWSLFQNGNIMGILFLLSPVWIALMILYSRISFKSDVNKDKKFLLETFQF